MAQRKIRHSVVRYHVKGPNGRKQFETAFRNQVVDIPDDQVKRLDEFGATVKVDEDLPRPGRMLALSETAGDAEILSWVMGASEDEVSTLVKERPAMAGRLESARETIAQRFSEQDKHLGGDGLKGLADQAQADAEKAEAEAQAAAEAEAKAKAAADAKTPEAEAQAAAEAKAKAAADAKTPENADDDLIGDKGEPKDEFTAEAADKIVADGASPAKDFIADNPHLAGEVLDAENRLAAKEDREPRVSIVKAAQAAAGFTQ